ncbi:MAG TPA: ClpX C4-type zinc finger protein [Ktedonobacterales bacterium]
MARRQGPFTCSFCGKGREQTRRVIAGPNRVYICAECVTLCNEILAEGQPGLSQQTCEEARETVHPRRMGWRRLLHGWLPSHLQLNRMVAR